MLNLLKIRKAIVVLCVSLFCFGLVQAGGPEEERAQAQALFDQGLAYYTGEGVEQSYDKAMEYFKQAADLSLSEAFNMIGTMYINAQGAEQSYKLAAKNLHQAGLLGDANAWYNMGIMRYNGWYYTQSYDKAFECFGIAADKGLVGAQCNLGVMYYNGEGVEQNLEEGFKYIKLAAKQGFTDAQYHLGLSFLDGDGIEQSDETAEKWLQIAADQEHEKAKSMLEELQGYRKLKSIAEQGDMDTQYQLAVLLMDQGSIVWDDEAAKKMACKSSQSRAHASCCGVRDN